MGLDLNFSSVPFLMPPTEETQDPIPAGNLAIFIRGTRGHCPRCDGKDLFQSPFRLREQCPRCALPLEMEDGWSYGSVPLAYALACLLWVLPVSLAAFFSWISIQTAVALGLAGVFFLPIATFRFTKCMWIGLYYAILPNELRPRNPQEKGDIH